MKYSYIPLDIDIEEECPLPPLVSAKTLALGICAEYSMISGMYEQSVMYSDRFKEDMLQLNGSKSSLNHRLLRSPLTTAYILS